MVRTLREESITKHIQIIIKATDVCGVNCLYQRTADKNGWFPFSKQIWMRLRNLVVVFWELQTPVKKNKRYIS